MNEDISELIKQKNEVDEVCDTILSQIEAAEANQKTGNAELNHIWYAKAKAALRHNRRRRQQLQEEISDRKREQRIQVHIENNVGFLNDLVTASKEMLTADQFDAVFAEAKLRHKRRQESENDAKE